LNPVAGRDGDFRRVLRRRRLSHDSKGIGDGSSEMSAPPFDVLYIDPPWHYNYRGNLRTRVRGGACQHYPLMRIEEICALPVHQIAARTAVLFLWIAMPKILEYPERVIDAWGFHYSTGGFTWVKITRGSACGFCGGGTPVVGPGFFTGSNAEPCLLGRRGKAMKPARKLMPSIIFAPRGRHSEKPIEAARRIEQMYPDARKLELFVRKPRPGWTCIGNGISGRDIREDLCRLREDKR
jgi:N6-adenosine-specific RNA methylase IME4